MTDESNWYRTQYPEPDWHMIAEQASKESDPRKLAYLIQALCDRLELMQSSRANQGARETTQSQEKSPGNSS